jgi:uncharacterized protein VirK/YbjX
MLMNLQDLIWLWKSSARVCEGKAPVFAIRRVKFLLAALSLSRALRPILTAAKGTALERQVRHRPELIGAVLWPYQCMAWDAHTRFARICEHYEIVQKIGPPVDFSVDGETHLLDLTKIRPGLTVNIDHAKWFIREGELVINLFLDNIRIYSLAFSFFYNDGEIAAFVGAIQGRDIDGALEIYKELTKAAHGMRPPDLLIELFGMFCNSLGISRVFAVSDAFRHHRSSYFGRGVKSFSTNYDQIWIERGGVAVNPMSYELKQGHRRRDPSDIPSKKRTMYRRRYDMLDSLQRSLMDNFPDYRSASTLD